MPECTRSVLVSAVAYARQTSCLTMQDVRRVRLEAVWIVHNESDTDRIKGPSGIFAAAPESESALIWAHP